MFTLQLIRHAKTNQHSHSGKDFDRELLPKGIAQANMLAQEFLSHNLELGKCLVSAAVRTKQTFSIMQQHGVSFTEVQVQPELYLASAMELLAFLHQQTDPLVTLIGHNEGISELLCYCVDDYEHLKTSGFIQLVFDLDQWDQLSRGTGMIRHRYRPEVFAPLAV